MSWPVVATRRATSSRSSTTIPGWALRAGRNSPSTPRCSSRPPARNQAPPRPTRTGGFSTSVIPRMSTKKARARSSSPAGMASCTWWRPVNTPSSVRGSAHVGGPSNHRRRTTCREHDRSGCSGEAVTSARWSTGSDHEPWRRPRGAGGIVLGSSAGPGSEGVTVGFVQVAHGRGGGIRTHGPSLPKRVRYQAALHPVRGSLGAWRGPRRRRCLPAACRARRCSDAPGTERRDG